MHQIATKMQSKVEACLYRDFLWNIWNTVSLLLLCVSKLIRLLFCIDTTPLGLLVLVLWVEPITTLIKSEDRKHDCWMKVQCRFPCDKVGVLVFKQRIRICVLLVLTPVTVCRDNNTLSKLSQHPPTEYQFTAYAACDRLLVTYYMNICRQTHL